MQKRGNASDIHSLTKWQKWLRLGTTSWYVNREEHPNQNYIMYVLEMAIWQVSNTLVFPRRPF